jgi:predicted nucleotidyltransferase
MKPCQRCGEPIDNKDPNEEDLTFECEKCKDVKFSREKFASVVEQVKKNFKTAIHQKFGPALKELYLFGSYPDGKPICGDLDVLVIVDRDKIKEFALQSRKYLRKMFNELCIEFYYIDELDPVIDGYISKEFVEWIQDNNRWRDFLFDFRTCDEFPDCMEGDCYMLETCKLPKSDYRAKLHQYCIEECQSPDRDNFGIPECFARFSEIYCPFLDTELIDRIRETLIMNLSVNADISFTRDDKDYKILHLNLYDSVEQFNKMGFETTAQIYFLALNE